MLEKKREDDKNFRDKYANLTGEIVVGNIQAWMDPTISVDGNQREKLDYYSRAEPTPYSLKNAPITSESEYHMIEGLDDPVAKMVSDNFTVQMTTSLDVNHASLLLIHALIPELTPDALQHLDQRRNDVKQGGPFLSADDFWNFLETLGNYSDAKQNLANQGITVLGSDATYHAVITAHVDTTNTNKTWLADIGPLPPPDPGSVSTSTSTNLSTYAYAAQSTGTTTSASTSASTSTGTADDYNALSVVYLKTE
jgi:type II secretory pathway component PulK